MSSIPANSADLLIFSTWKMRKLMLGEVKWLAGGRTAGTVQSSCWKSVLPTMLGTRRQPMKLFQSAVKRVLRDRQVQLPMWFLKGFLKMTKYYKHKEFYWEWNCISAVSYSPTNITDALRAGALPFPSAGAQHLVGAPDILTEAFIWICPLCEIRAAGISLVALYY